MLVIFKNLGEGQMIPLHFTPEPDQYTKGYSGNHYLILDIPDVEAEKLKAFYDLHKKVAEELLQEPFTPTNGLICIEVLSSNGVIGKVISISKNAIESANHKDVKVGSVVRLKSNYADILSRIGRVRYITVGDIAGVRPELQQ